MASGLLFFTDIPTFGFTTDLTAGELTFTTGAAIFFCGAGLAGAAVLGAFLAAGSAAFLGGAAFAGAAFTGALAGFLATTFLAGADPFFCAGLAAGLTAFLAIVVAAFLAGADGFFAAAAFTGLAGAFFTIVFAAGFALADDFAPAVFFAPTTLAGAFFPVFGAGLAPAFTFLAEAGAFFAGAFLIAFLAITKSVQFVIKLEVVERATLNVRLVTFVNAGSG
ncbi:MAG: hypothetical protein IM638_04970 [Bacteroidetes bacterium]|nr:hypothetical protein [Bacteroidota bacterium]